MQKEVLGVDIGGVIIDRINDWTDTSFFGENYLRVYGLLQAIFLQQDAIRCLHDQFVGASLEPQLNWKEIRELRNLSSGHPLEKSDRSGTRRTMISRITIVDQGFQLMIS